MLASPNGPAIFPAARTTNRSPKVWSKTDSRDGQNISRGSYCRKNRLVARRLCPVGRLRGHKAHLRVADFSVQSKCNFEMLDELLNRRKLWPRLSSGFETKDRCVKCPSRTHRIEIFS